MTSREQEHWGTARHDAAWRPADVAYAQLAREIPGLRVSRYFARQGTRRVEGASVLAEMTSALDRLAGELGASGCVAILVIRGGLWRPSLVARSPVAALRTTEIIADDGWFWWPGAWRLCPVTEPARAARLITSILRPGPAPGGESSWPTCS